MKNSVRQQKDDAQRKKNHRPGQNAVILVEDPADDQRNKRKQSQIQPYQISAREAVTDQEYTESSQIETWRKHV